MQEWIKKLCPGTVTAQTTPYHLSRYTYTPLSTPSAPTNPQPDDKTAYDEGKAQEPVRPLGETKQTDTRISETKQT